MGISYFNIAGFGFAVKADADVVRFLPNLEPFVCDAVNELELAFTLELDAAVAGDRDVIYHSDDFFFDIARCGDGYSMEFAEMGAEGRYVMEFGAEFKSFKTNMRSDSLSPVLDNMLMIAFTFATAGRDALLIHSSVVVVDNKAYMFLGKSGTGKSTHAGLWLKYIDGAMHLNDDNPVLKYSDGKAYACGSAWSGKGRIFKNEAYEVGGIVRLAQAPYNKIERRTGAKAFALVYTSCSKLPWSEVCMEHICSTLGKITAVTPVYYLECLPDRDAALLSFNTMKQL